MTPNVYSMFIECLEYLQRLPYKCRAQANVTLAKTLDEVGKCHRHTLNLPQRKNEKVSRHIGIWEAERGEFPHMALVGTRAVFDSEKNPRKTIWVCGGAVISEWFVLTSKNCLSLPGRPRYSKAEHMVALGIINESDPPEYWKIHETFHNIRHPDYLSHDIGLLKTKTEIVFGADVLPMCLDVGDADTSDNIEIIGWGHPRRDKTQPIVLAVKTDVEELRELSCAAARQTDAFSSLGRLSYDPDTQLCYKQVGAPIDNNCPEVSWIHGVVQAVENGCMYTAVGLTTSGNICASSLKYQRLPALFTRVSYYVPWIESIVWPQHTDEQ